MSDSAQSNQQFAVSKMQAPGTSVQAAPSASSLQSNPGQVPAGDDSKDPAVQAVVAEEVEKKEEPASTVSSAVPQSYQINDSTVSASQNTPPSIVSHKEAGPVTISAPIAESTAVVEEIQPSHPEVSIPAEVKEVVSPSEEAKPVKLDTVVKQAGVHLTGEATPVIKTPSGMVQLPMTYADALATEKRTKFWDALHWFAAFVAYQWRKLDPTIKE